MLARAAASTQEAARVRVTLRDGTTREQFVEHVIGFPEHPMDHDDVEAKALELMQPVLGAEGAREVVDLAWRVRELSDVGALVGALSRASSR